MPRHLAFLRGINLGKRRVKMTDLQALFVDLGFTEVETFIASGNVVFTASARDTAKLETKIEAHLRKNLGYDVETHVRGTPEFLHTLETCPFPHGDDLPSVHVGFLREPLPPALATRFIALSGPEDVFAVRGRELFWQRVGRMSDSVIWESKELRALKLPSFTLRNLNTLKAMVEKLSLSPA